MSTPECRSPRGDAAHLLSCPACRGRIRLDAAWKALPRPQREEGELEPGPRFVSTVLRSIRLDRDRRARLRLALAAAAALLFFFCFGTGHETASPVQPSPEDSLVSLAAPNALTGLIPN